jgi:hypothetical protein
MQPRSDQVENAPYTGIYSTGISVPVPVLNQCIQIPINNLLAIHIRVIFAQIRFLLLIQPQDLL